MTFIFHNIAKAARVLCNIVDAFCDLVPPSLVALVARIATGWVFWASARTKVLPFEGWLDWQSWQFWSVTETTRSLFAYLYRVPLLPPDWAAFITAVNEHVFSVLLVLGIASRFSATVFLFMTLVIQAFVLPQSWPDHMLWAACLLYIMRYGPGKISVSYLWERRHQKSLPDKRSR